MKRGVLRNFAKFTGKHLCQSLFFNKVAGLRPATLLKKILCHRCFLVNFAKFLRIPSLQNTSGQLLLVSFASMKCLLKMMNTSFSFYNIFLRVNLNFLNIMLEIRLRFSSCQIFYLMQGSHIPKNVCFICSNQSPLKLMKNIFCFILKGLFILKIIKFLS